MKNLPTTIAALVAAFAAATALAQNSTGASGHSAHHPAAAASSSASSALAEGEVRKVDKEQGKITLRHGPIASLDMAAMTMAFRVKDPALLDRFKTGDKVRFAAERVGGAFVITQIEAAN